MFGPARPRPASRLRRVTAPWLLASAACASAAQAQDSRPVKLAISVAEPEGFSGLTRPQQVVVDVFVAGKRIGDALVIYRPGALTFMEPAALVERLPDVADKAAVHARLAAADLPTHSGLTCRRGSDPATCGVLSPDIADVIFDPDRFRADIFINPRLTTIKGSADAQYLPAPEPNLSVINGIGMVASGAVGGAQTYNLRNRLLIGNADRRLRAELYYASRFGIQSERIAAEIDRPGWRFMAGSFYAPGTELFGRQKMMGLGAQTQWDTRVDNAALRGDPLIVFLRQRSRVDILREGRLISSAVYEGGNQSLDTSGLPDGSYEVVLRIEETGGARREERRFFTQNPSVPALGQKRLHAFAGVIENDRKAGLFNPTPRPFVQAGLAIRPARHLALDASAVLDDCTVIGEFGADLITAPAHLRVAVVATTDGTLGQLVRLSSSGADRLNFNLDVRHVSLGDSERNDTDRAVPRVNGLAQTGSLPPFFLRRDDFTALSGNLIYDLPGTQFMIAGAYSRVKGEESSYSIGPSVRVDLMRNGPARLFANGNVAFTEKGRSGFVGFTLQLFRSNASFNASAGAQSATGRGDRSPPSPVGSVSAGLQTSDGMGGDIQIGAGYERAAARDMVTATASYASPVATVHGDVIRNLSGAAKTTQFSLGFDTTIALSGDVVTFEGKQQSDSMILAEVKGDAAGHFEVLVDESRAGVVRSGDRLPLSLLPYRRYSVRVRPLEADPIQYDSSVREVALFPGSVIPLEWRAHTAQAMFGRLVAADGQPLASAAVSASGSIGQTDEQGYFQLETAPGAVLTVSSAGRKQCEIALPRGEQRNGYVRLGTLPCPAAQLVAK